MDNKKTIVYRSMIARDRVRKVLVRQSDKQQEERMSNLAIATNDEVKKGGKINPYPEYYADTAFNSDYEERLYHRLYREKKIKLGTALWRQQIETQPEKIESSGLCLRGGQLNPRYFIDRKKPRSFFHKLMFNDKYPKERFANNYRHYYNACNGRIGDLIILQLLLLGFMFICLLGELIIDVGDIFYGGGIEYLGLIGAGIFFLLWLITYLIYRRIPNNRWDYFDRQMGQYVVVDKHGQPCRRYDYKNCVFYIRTVLRANFTTGYAFCIYHPKFRFRSPLYYNKRDVYALRDYILQFMDIAKPLPDHPCLEAQRHLDPVTKAYDERTNRPSHYWRDMSDVQIQAKVQAAMQEAKEKWGEV